MFNCDWCGNNPFANIFGSSLEATRHVNEIPRDDADSDDSEGHERRRELKQNLDKHEPRSIANQEKVARAWLLRCSNRVHKEWPSDDAKLQVLKEILKNVHYTEDPVLGKQDDCVTWYGKRNDFGEPVMEILDGSGTTTILSVMQTLVYMFADDDSFEALKKWPRNKPYDRVCRAKNCIAFVHVEVPE